MSGSDPYDRDVALRDSRWLTTRLVDLLADLLSDGCRDDIVNEVLELAATTIDWESWLHDPA